MAAGELMDRLLPAVVDAHRPLWDAMLAGERAPLAWVPGLADMPESDD